MSCPKVAAVRREGAVMLIFWERFLSLEKRGQDDAARSWASWREEVRGLGSVDRAASAEARFGRAVVLGELFD